MVVLGSLPKKRVFLDILKIKINQNQVKQLTWNSCSKDNIEIISKSQVKCKD